MTREELEAALGRFLKQEPAIPYNLHTDLRSIIAAARKQLALMPEVCEPAGTIHASTCVCHGSGKVYPPETVEKIAKAIEDRVYTKQGWAMAVAVLDALGEA